MAATPMPIHFQPPVQKTLLFWIEISCQEYAVSFKGISPGNS